MHLNKRIFLTLLVSIVLGITGAIEDRKSNLQNKLDGQVDSKQSSDYEYSDESEVSNAEITAPNATIRPYFEHAVNTVYVSKEGENVALTCLPKNFNDSKHQILWYKDDHPITTGNNVVSTGDYELDNKFNLIIHNYTKSSTGNYSCSVLPADIKQYVVIKFNEPDNLTNGCETLTNIRIFSLFSMLFLIRILSCNFSENVKN